MFPVPDRQAPVSWKVRSATTVSNMAASDDSEPQTNADAWSQAGLKSPTETRRCLEELRSPDELEGAASFGFLGRAQELSHYKRDEDTIGRCYMWCCWKRQARRRKTPWQLAQSSTGRRDEM